MSYDRSLAVNAITLRATTPSPTPRPASGTNYHRIAVKITRADGSVEAPDAATIYVRAVTRTGTTLASRLFADNAGASALAASAHASFASGSGWYQQATALGTGEFEVYLSIASGAAEDRLTIEVGCLESGRIARADAPLAIGDQADLDTVQTDITSILTDTGDGTDAAVAPGVAGSLHSHLREAQAQADSIQTEVDKIGAATDATAAAGAAGSLHAHVRGAQADIDLVEADLGDFTGRGANLLDLLTLGPFREYDVAASPAPTTTTFALAAITGGAPIPSAIHSYRDMPFVVLSGTNKGQFRRIDAYSAADLVTFTGNMTLTAGDKVAILITSRVGATVDAASRATDGTASLASLVRWIADSAIGDPSAGPAAFNTLAEILGLPTDAAVDPDSVNGSLYAYIKHVVAHLHTIEASVGAKHATFTSYWAAPTGNLGTTLPQDDEIAAGSTADNSAAFEAIDTYEVVFTEDAKATLEDIYFWAKWTTDTTTGTGTNDSKIMLAPKSATVTLGAAPPGAAVDVTTTRTTVDGAKTTHQAEGRIKRSALPATDGVKFLLAAKPNTAAEVVTATIFTSQRAEITYRVAD